MRKKPSPSPSGRAANEQPHVFTGSVEHAIAHIEESISDKVDAQNLRWYAIKLLSAMKKWLRSWNSAAV